MGEMSYHPSLKAEGNAGRAPAGGRKTMHEYFSPMHLRMFGKTRTLDSFARELAAYSDQQGWTTGLAASIDEQLPRLQGEFTDLVDPANVHSSIEALVNRSEAVLAAALAPLAGHLPEVESFARQKGRETAAAEQAGPADLQRAWDVIDRHWLDGMPCDRRLRFTADDDDVLAWEFELEPHPALGYAAIREAWTRGFAEEAGLSLEAEPGAYSLRRAE